MQIFKFLNSSFRKVLLKNVKNHSAKIGEYFENLQIVITFNLLVHLIFGGICKIEIAKCLAELLQRYRS